jgi:plastocyanin
MKSVIFVLLAMLVLVACTPAQQPVQQNTMPPSPPPVPQTPPPAAGTLKLITESPFTIEINDYKFTPNDIIVRKGVTVIWVNKDSMPHTVTSEGSEELKSVQLNPGETYNHTFTAKGSYAYHCNFHPYMKAMVNVE